MNETFTPEHYAMLHRMFVKAAHKRKRSPAAMREFLHWSWRFGIALHAKSGSDLTRLTALSCRDANRAKTIIETYDPDSKGA